MAETHGFPRPDCLELLVAALDEGATAVMPRLGNANPALLRSWASLFATYGAYTGTTPRQLTDVALHNGCFRREALAEVAACAARSRLRRRVSERLRAEGCEMRYVPDAVLDHVNVTSLRGSSSTGRSAAASGLPRRSTHWSGRAGSPTQPRFRWRRS